ncbi:MAG: sulfurtransferase TusA family protein [Oscillospiraceae bacterium]|nr:sulfurtransferase TusA family protein [Candidatus Ruminococcus equi]
MIDARGLSCPTPVLLTQKEIKKNCDTVEVLVDNKCSVENISRLANNCGYKMNFEEKDGDFSITLTKEK